jgi:hypothetical protein
MKIRSITCFVNPGWPLDEARLDRAGQFAAAARRAFEQAGYPVQTTRLASIPFSQMLPTLEMAEALKLAHDLQAAARARGFDYLSLGPALPAAPASYTLIPEMLAATENVFFSGLLTTPGSGISLPAVHACAKIIVQAAALTPDGFTNLRFAALANVPPGAPFFPAAYHAGESPAFALATESADLAVTAFTAAPSLEAARRALVAAIEHHGQVLAAMGAALAREHDIAFGGLDFSLAPFPTEAQSLGAAMERLGAPRVGLHGSLAAAALLTEAIDRAVFPHCGFSGLMLPVLEDATLAARAADGALTVTDLLLYSAVCGTGLDTIPLPGDVTAGPIAAVLLDLAALAQRLDKPLTARLMPIPGKRAGDPTDFDFAYFANSRVMALRAEGLHGNLAGDEIFHLASRK